MSVVYDSGNITVKIEGIEEVNRRLEQLEIHIRRRLLVDAMKKSMRDMMSFAEGYAPKGDNVERSNKKQGGARYSHRGGNLKRSFKIVKPRGNDPYTLETRLINKAYYARWVEYGHNIVKQKKIVGWSPPVPFMRPTFEACKGKVVTDIAILINAALSRRGV